ncbi:hypothetical protein B0T17DRAFT_625660 [Bombardia bombarda]|uniref:SH3 domain-containing protein n=1 Tax=Bombardia bombarda TaxID=252184 RepID=A0AA39XLJ0_9PEZI|nr:hypothetical protein B0T17DRAFT_625660 [Bombardia bombarda]
MVFAPPPLPMRFPCWVRAVYSWGGESKRDLGFIEGDLIECLNAGDGSWWTGRLWRDRRAIGLFPSNFVEVLPDTFRPTTRSTSPLPSSNTPSPKNTPQKSRTFRKPFEAYAKAPHYTTAKIPETYKEQPVRPRETSATSVINAPAAPPAPAAPVAVERSPSPLPPLNYRPRANTDLNVRDPSPPQILGRVGRPTASMDMGIVRDVSRDFSPPRVSSYDSRAPSPAPSYRPYRPPQSQTPQFQEVSYHQGGHEREDSPPPPPPPHRHTGTPRHGSSNSFGNRFNEDASRQNPNGSFGSRFNHDMSRHNSNASYNHQFSEDMSRHTSNASYNRPPSGYQTPRKPSPIPIPIPSPTPSPSGLSRMTPSPLREAMDHVMEQLDALGSPRRTDSPEPPFDPWSPESFDMVQHRSKRKPDQLRPKHQRDPTFHEAFQEQQMPPAQLSSYVERMESRLRNVYQQAPSVVETDEAPPPPPPKNQAYERPKSSMGIQPQQQLPDQRLRHKKSAYEVGRHVLNRTFTSKTNSTNVTNTSASTDSTNRSLMSGVSAGGISATSAGSLARKNQSRAQSALGMREFDTDRPETPFTGVTYHSSHASGQTQVRPKSQIDFHDDSLGVASTRGSIATAGASSSATNLSLAVRPSAITSISGGTLTGKFARDTTREMGMGNGVDWVQVRRDVNRSNSLSRNERSDRKDRCQMLDYPALDPVDELYNSIDGDEGADGMPVQEPINYMSINLSQVDKNSRFIAGLPPTTTAITLATTYVCRPYRSDVQRLRAIFIWVAEKICWEEDFEGQVDTRRVIQSKRGCAEEYAVLVLDMCNAMGLPCEVVRGYLKPPGEIPDSNLVPRSNHWWNAVLVDNEWRMIDCCLASPSNPRRGLYSSHSGSTADPFWFLTRPSEICWTHIPEHHEQQHMCPPVAHEVLLNLPCACPPYFKNGLEMVDYNTSLTRIEDLEMVHIKFNVPPDVEIAAEVEVRAYSRDSDGDFFESGDVVKKRALAQAEWFGGVKRFTVKALLPGDEGTGVLKVYAGKRGLMHSIKDIPHPLAFALPIIHTGENPPYEFVTRHPTPHAQRHDIYVVQPQCQRLALNNTFVFAIRQHPSAMAGASAGPPSVAGSGLASPIPFMRPGSAMSMTSSAAGSNPSTLSSGSGSSGGSKKPAKLAIQTPGGKILRLMRKEERRGVGVGAAVRGPSAVGEDEVAGDGGTWETIIKCSERGTWRGLVLADRTARWCVFAEWVCE